MVSMEMASRNAEKMLEDFANLKVGDKAAIEQWLQKYRTAFLNSFFEQVEREERQQDRLLAEDPLMADVVNPGGRSAEEIREDAIYMRLWGCVNQLRNAWDHQNPHDQEWYVDELRRWIYVRTEPVRSKRVPAPPPSDTGFQQALRYLRNNAEKAKHCGNPECRKPYFFVSKDVRERYCSEACKRWGKLESKKLSARKRRAKEKKARRK
jgi:hypothetical protein